MSFEDYYMSHTLNKLTNMKRVPKDAKDHDYMYVFNGLCTKVVIVK